VPVSDPVLDQHLQIDPSGPTDALLAQVPARWAVYLMADCDNRPVQLLAVKNLRRSLQSRLVEDPLPVPTRRANLSQIVRNIHYRRVDSRFEADLVYLQAAERFFPDLLDRMPGFQPAWFLAIDPKAPFPRFTRVDDPAGTSGAVLGPVESRQAAQSLIENLEDWFDLCRYYHILTEAPHGKACAYKEMGKCPAPCDGTISLATYRAMIERAMAFLVDPAEELRSIKAQMDTAAKQLHFERAASLKARMDEMSHVRASHARHMRTLEEFVYVSIQPGPRKGTAKVFLATPAGVKELAAVVKTSSCPPEMLDLLRTAAADACDRQAHEVPTRVLGVVAHQLFSAGKSQGSLIHLSELTSARMERALKELSRAKPADEAVNDTDSRELGIA
jgi:excinuclease UvrABC nuclease subunit